MKKKKAKVTKKCIIKQDHLEWLENHQLILRSQQRFKTDAYNVYTQYVHKIALSSKDDKLNLFDKAKTYAYGTSTGIVCKEKILKYKWWLILEKFCCRCNKNRAQTKLAIHFISSLQNINNRRFWIKKKIHHLI